MVVWIWMIVWTFFGWNSDPSDENTLHDTSTWFVEMINDIWDLQMDTWDLEQNYSGYIKINVMMPKYLYSSGWKNFAQDLYEYKNVYMNFVFVDDLNLYRDQLYDIGFSGADLFLYPYDWNEKVATRSFSNEQSVQTYFDELLYPIVQGNRNSFLPFSADPMVIYSFSWLSVYNFREISELVINRESVSPLSFPLFFGINTEDFDKEWFVWEYQDIVWYALLHYFKTHNDLLNLERWIDSNVMESYNIPDLRTISNAISAPECDYFPSLCFQLYNFVWVRFWFLSDADVVRTYFSWKQAKFDNLSINPLPFSQLESPVRIRWRWIRGSLEDEHKINAIGEFMEQYLGKYDEYNLRKSTLSVFGSDRWNWLLDNNYIWLRWYVLVSGWDYINSLRNMTKFWELIWHKITAKEYLR